MAKTVGLRPTEEEESQGVGIVDHGEEGYSNN
ncbi:MAG: ammonium transporter [Verrucomicrobia bacterium]|nr:ammonium transporter [Verrucomicrobiota bacterium]